VGGTPREGLARVDPRGATAHEPVARPTHGLGLRGCGRIEDTDVRV